MRAEHLEILVEEWSMEAFLRELLPRVLGDAATFQIYRYQCKDDLLNKLPARLKGYAAWLPPNWRVLVVVDRDDDNCEQLKQKMEAVATGAGLVTPSEATTDSWQVVNRIAIEELEAWFFGEWEAVRSCYPKIPATVPHMASYRNSDGITGGTWEAFERILQRAGYFRGGLRKIEAARTIGRCFDPTRNSSHSFRVFHDALQEAVLL